MFTFYSGVYNNQVYGPEIFHYLEQHEDLATVQEFGIYAVPATGSQWFFYDGEQFFNAFSKDCPMEVHDGWSYRSLFEEYGLQGPD